MSPPPELKSASDQLAYMTMRIECNTPAGLSTGTGFTFEFELPSGWRYPALVTNKHVVRDARAGRFWMHISEQDGAIPKESIRIEYSDFGRRWIPHPDPNVDLCIFGLGTVVEAIRKTGKHPFVGYMDRSLFLTETDHQDVKAVEEILMVGYPNGLWDDKNNMPIFRRGITATSAKIDYRGKKEFLIDAACFPGSSGSPVLLFNEGAFLRQDVYHVGTKVRLLGILYAGPQHLARGDILFTTSPIGVPHAAVRIPNNLGTVIKAERLNDFLEILAKGQPDGPPIDVATT